MEMMRRTGSVYKSYKHPFGYRPIVIYVSHLFKSIGILTYHVLAIVGEENTVNPMEEDPPYGCEFYAWGGGTLFSLTA